LLKLNQLSVSYGKVTAVRDISLEVPKGQIVTLLGANGAGKSTTLRAISGLIRPASGSIELDGQRIDHLDPAAIVRRGISQSPEGREVFPELTVLENLMIGAYTRSDQTEIQSDLESVYNYFPILRDRQQQNAATLSGGEQQMLAIGRALMSRPSCLLLDEPSLGLAPKIVRQIFGIIREINKSGVSILLVEQNVNLALQVAAHAYVLETGSITLQGPASELVRSEHMRKAYLGGRGA
jgi:branched-chain amino acid transport system ATP-binding protein